MKKMLGDGPYPFPIEDINIGEKTLSYSSSGMIIIRTKDNLDLFEGKHVHESYEFIIPLSTMPPTYIDKKTAYLDENMLFPFNTEQYHGPTSTMYNCNILGIHIDKDQLQRVAHMIFNKSNVYFKNESIKPSKDLIEMLNIFKQEANNYQTGREFILQNLINLILVNLLRQLRSNVSEFLIERNYNEKENIKRVESYLRERYNQNYSLDEVAQIANLSPYHFIRTFKIATGKTPYDYLLDIKIEKARELLQQKNYSITEVCFFCGFNSLEHFASVFKRKMGMLPSQYKKLFNE